MGLVCIYICVCVCMCVCVCVCACEVSTCHFSREKVYEILTQNDIEVPHYAVLKRPSEQDTGGKYRQCSYSAYTKMWQVYRHWSIGFEVCLIMYTWNVYSTMCVFAAAHTCTYLLN